MCLEVYSAYLDNIDLTDKQKSDLIESLTVICENIIDAQFCEGDSCYEPN
jgi:hypothetical protein